MRTPETLLIEKAGGVGQADPAPRRHLEFDKAGADIGGDARAATPLFVESYILQTDADPLGEGYNGKVLRAICRKSGRKVAVKVLADNQQSQKEIECQRSAGSKAVQILDVFTESAAMWKSVLGGLPPMCLGRVKVVVLELMEGGELFYFIQSRSPKRLTESETKIVAVKLAEALSEMHANGVLHRDIKPENILLCGGDEIDLKICDFGFSYIGPLESGVDCTVAYAAPEIIRHIVFGKMSAPITVAADCWSLGVILYICLCGKLPFRTRDNAVTSNFQRDNLNGNVKFTHDAWTNVSNAAKSVVLGLLTVDKTSRLTANDVLRHPWLRDVVKPQPELCTQSTANEADIVAMSSVSILEDCCSADTGFDSETCRNVSDTQ